MWALECVLIKDRVRQGLGHVMPESLDPLDKLNVHIFDLVCCQPIGKQILVSYLWLKASSY